MALLPSLYQDGAGLGRPLEVAGALVGIPEDYHKKPNVFRIILRSGVEMLLIADTSRSVQRWIETLRKVSGLEIDMVRKSLAGCWRVWSEEKSVAVLKVVVCMHYLP